MHGGLQDCTSVVSIFSGLMIYDKDLMDAIVQHILEHPQAFSEACAPIPNPSGSSI